MKKLLLSAGALMLSLLSFAQCEIIFVSTTGSPAAAGTMADPLDITTAFTTVGQDEVIRIATGTYTINAPLTIAFDNVFVEGGFDDFNSWQKTSMAGATTINRSTLNAEGSANATRLVAIYANGITGFEIHDITITTDNAALAGSSTYGMHIENCSNYSIVRCQIFPGNGGTGANGANGVIGANGLTGGGGASGSIDDECAGGAGGTGGAGGGVGGGVATAGGTNPGGCTQTGGAGPNGADSSNPRAGGAGGGGGAGGEEAYNGGAGGQGGGVNGGANQLGAGAGGTWGDPGGDGGTGTNGAAGTPGVNGAVGAAGQTNTYFVPGVQAVAGTDGGGGKGGAGGGGGGGQYCGFCIDGSGNGGGGGGGGGQGGTGGTGGFGGGGSFGVYLFNNGLNGTVNNCTISAGNGGNGGTAGIGGPGGLGGPLGVGPNVGTSEIGEGGEGGTGGAGGAGGAGGNGSNGLSASIQLASGVALTLSDDAFDLAALPEITVEYVTCTAESASFKDETMPVGTGNVLWNFGVNASTQFATDNPSSTSFNTIGQHTITQGSSAYADFVNITCSVDASATESAGVITANTAGAQYIWVDCNTGFFPVPGETAQSFITSVNGDYAVIVTENGCSDTSACFNITYWGVNEMTNNFVRIYPNPVKDEITLEFASMISTGTVRILDISGKLVEEFSIDNTVKISHEFNFPKGVYVIELLTDDQHSVQRVIKE